MFCVVLSEYSYYFYFLLVFFLMIRRPPRSTRTEHSFPTRRSSDLARRDQMQHRFLAADHQRVTRVMAALETNHRRNPYGQQIDDFADRKSTRLNSSH